MAISQRLVDPYREIRVPTSYSWQDSCKAALLENGLDQNSLGRRLMAGLLMLPDVAWVEMRARSSRRREKGKQERSNSPRFPQFRAQIFRFQAENCVDTDEATV